MSYCLIFDAVLTGHHGEFLENMIWGLPKSATDEYLIVTHPGLQCRLEASKVASGSNIRLSYLTDAQLKTVDSSKRLIERGRRELAIVEELCSVWDVDRVLLMHMNVHQLALRSHLRQKSISVRGILLDPYTPIRRSITLRQKMRSCITGLRKKMQFCIMLSNPQLDRIFVLNDAALAKSLNQIYPKRHPFVSVVDPIPAAVALSEQVEPRAANSSDRFTFLFMGSLASRKGCLEVVKALSYLSSEELSKIRLRFVGRFIGDQDYKKKVLTAIETLSFQFSNVCIEVVDRYVDFSEMDVELQQADCVLAPYIGFHGSSGILGHACRSQKPMIACEEGLLGELVRELKVGATVNPNDVDALSACLSRAVRGELPFSTEAAARYAASADYHNFCEILIGEWGDDKK